MLSWRCGVAVVAVVPELAPAGSAGRRKVDHITRLEPHGQKMPGRASFGQLLLCIQRSDVQTMACCPSALPDGRGR